jgi:hypothetical protein
MKLESYGGLQKVHEELSRLSKTYPNKYIHGISNNDVTGDYMYHSKNSFNVFDCSGVEDSRYLNHGHDVASCQDCYVIVDKSEFSYEAVSAITTSRIVAGYCVWNTNDADYCDTCENSSNLFGCVGLNNASYCILNKQYSKEEYHALKSKIKIHMKNMPFESVRGVRYMYGEFFPYELSPFAYNETVAMEYIPLSETEARTLGSSFRHKEVKKHAITLEVKNHPLSFFTIPDSITNEVIECFHQGTCRDACTGAFRVTTGELDMYRKLKLPLPRLCPNCRHARRFSARNKQTLTKQRCMCDGAVYKNSRLHEHGSDRCRETFLTTYTPHTQAIVYCDRCYKEEVS